MRRLGQALLASGLWFCLFGNAACLWSSCFRCLLAGFVVLCFDVFGSVVCWCCVFVLVGYVWLLVYLVLFVDLVVCVYFVWV